MKIIYRLDAKWRNKLKEPLGTLITGSFSETLKQFKEMVKKEKPNYITFVGDVVSKMLLKTNSIPFISIIDNRVMRKSIKPIILKTNNVFYVKNPPGTITEEALIAIQKAFKKVCSGKNTKIIVDGEEDLLTLIAILYAPEKSFIVYGQPCIGVVVVTVSELKKAVVTEILKSLKINSEK